MSISQQTRERVKGEFARLGIDPARIVLLGKTNRAEHLAAFNLIDIALDPFPQGGGVSALEGLMMGVPVVTLRWPTLAGRVSASMVTSMGLTGWIAETPERYVELAIQKSRDLQSLSELRGAAARHLRCVGHRRSGSLHKGCRAGVPAAGMV